MIRVFSDRRCLEHRVPPGYPELPVRLTGILEGLEAVGYEAVEAGAHAAAERSIFDVHDRRYCERFRAAVERGDGLLISSDNPLSPGTWTAARAAVDVALHAADWIAGGPGRRALAAVRPPGHHAERSLAMGFCYFNNVAVAAAHLLAEHGLERVAIFDFDVHHGNGTQHIFEERADVFYASTHQHPFYPGTGLESETGRGAGAGATLNVPLAAGTGDAGYAAVIEEHIVPALRRFAPQALLISAGFDAWRGDPIGGMRVSREAFRHWGQLLSDLAAQVCEGRILSLLEGGYDLERLSDLTAAYLEGLGGESS